jgi:hypothetical protein
MTLGDHEAPVLPVANTAGTERLVACDVVIILRAAIGTRYNLTRLGVSLLQT